MMGVRHELDNCKMSNNSLRDNNADLLAELDALNHHAKVLSGQNDELNRELDKFLETDDMVRSHLDRRSRVQGIRGHNEVELQKSMHDIREARSRSPARRGYGSNY